MKTTDYHETDQWKELKFRIGSIFSEKIAISESGAIEGNPAIHDIAEWVWAYSDQQNKEKDLDLIAANQYVSELRKENKELREELSTMKAMFDFDKTRAEIQRLTKDVQNLINERDEIKRIGYANKGAYESIEQNDKREITRLRKLLAKAETLWDDLAEAGELKIGPKFSEKYDQLKKEINDTRNPKP